MAGPDVQMNPINVPRFDTVGAAPQQAVDTSAFNRLIPAAPPMLNAKDYMEMRGIAAQTQNAMNANQLFQQQQGARKAMGDIIQRHLDKSSGSLDFYGAANDMAANPQVAGYAPELLGQWIQAGNLNQDQLTKQMENHSIALGNAIRHIAPLTSMGTAVTSKDVIKQLYMATADGTVPDPTVSMAIATQATTLKSGKPLLDYLTRLQSQLQTPKDMLDQNLGVLTTMGGRPGIYRQSATGGQPQFTPTVKVISTDEEAAQYGAPIGTEVGADPQQAQPVPQPQGPVTQRQTPTPEQPPTPGQPKTTVFQVAPQISAFKGQTATEMQKYQSDLGDRAQAALGTLRSVGYVRQAMQAINTGGGAQTWMQLGSIAQAIGMPKDTVDALSLGDRGAAQVFEKAMLDIVTNEMRQAYLGLGQQKLMEYMNMVKALPNLESDPRAVATLLNFMEKKAKMVTGENTALQKWVGEWQQGKRKLEDFRPTWQKALLDRHVIDPELPDDPSKVFGAGGTSGSP